VAVHENDVVNAGDLLFRIDPAPYRIAIEQADAAIAAAQVRVSSLQTEYQTTGVDIESAREDVAFYEKEYQRQSALMQAGFTTRARLQAAEHALSDARSRVASAQANATKARAALATGSAAPGVNPAIKAGQAQREQALLNLARTEVRAPVSGVVSQADRLQLGQMMVQGLPGVTIVASNRSWIEANFKETDLAHMRVGQPAEITFDAYPELKLRGKVSSIGAGTGSEFSVLPAQNANGNWVKVTQRVPVRIAITDKPKRVMIAGLSAHVRIDTDR
jgi:membrane fusion protein (multidrug efflux system)